MQLDPQQKQQYLAEMGIDPWFPRASLSNAQPVVSLLPEVSPPPVVSQPISSEVPSIEPKSTPTQSNVSPEPVKNPEQAESVPTTQSVQQKPVRFGLGIYVVDKWIVVSSLVPDHQRFNEADVRLMLSILKAIDGTQQNISYHHVISWPFFSNPQASQGVDAAKQYVNGVLEHLTEAHPVENLLSFGGVLAKLNGWDSAEGEEFKLKRLNLPSVYKMLEDASQKQKAWQAIQNSSLFHL